MHHFERKRVGFSLGVCPINIVPHLVIYYVHPLSLGIIFTSSLPVLGMHQMDTTILIGFTSGSPPIEILVPLDARLFEAVELAHR
jgi:hypothetical protein